MERHFTFDHDAKGNDHKCSLLPEELAEMIKAIRRIEQSLGTSEKVILPSERVCIDKLGKTLVAAKDLKKGHKIEKQDLAVKVTAHAQYTKTNFAINVYVISGFGERS